MVEFKQIYSKKKELTEVRANFYKSVELNKLDFSGFSPPAVFVGSKLQYPKVNVGILNPVVNEHTEIFNAPNYWTEAGYSIQDIVMLRKQLINSRFQSTVKNANSEKLISVAQEISMAYKPVNVELKWQKSPVNKLDFDRVRLPLGITAPLKDAKLTENPRVDNKVEKAVSDVDLKAGDAVNYLFSNNVDENFISQLLSIGILGLKKNRKLVPTRWSITATDDTIGKNIIEEIKDYDTINAYSLFYGRYLGNYYFIMTFPEKWSYELFEAYLPFSVWNQDKEIKVASDYESYFGMKGYANATAGGYYASRLSCLEYLNKIKKQAGFIVIRFETPEYNAPLGVWVVRNAARIALSNEPIKFDDKDKMISYCKELIKARFNFDISKLMKNSKFLESLKQIRLNSFF